MAKLPPAPSCVFVRVVGTESTSHRPWNNIFHLQYAGTVPTATTLNTAATQILAAYGAQFMPLMVNVYSLTEVQLADLTSDTAAIGSATGSTAGSVAGVALSINATAVVSWTIARRYRGGHPRSYIPGQQNSDIAAVNTWTGTYTTALNNAATAFRAALNGLSVSGTSFTMVAVSYYDAKVLRPQGVPFPIIANAVHPRVDSQRRRLGREILA